MGIKKLLNLPYPVTFFRRYPSYNDRRIRQAGAAGSIARDLYYREDVADINDNLTPENLVSGHLEAVRGFCLAHARTVDDAEDIMQTVMLKAVKNLHKLKDRTRVRRWLIKVARRTCIDHYRETIRHVSSNRRPRTASSMQDAQFRDLHEAISRLADIYKETICLYYLDGHDCAGVANSLGISEATVRKRLVRGRIQLYDMLSGDTP
ncbi:MAG: sigma-70 family RNA polymerase sigma factor [Aliifodinibius sp.]|nr:sigma-70 family RNA polymerase sigma factor [Phycisphaerae bacterium]NIT60309.1 sigma-70 family RNA polymerase sigma factor [Fodinibius sp.]NIY28891.1 sigma-70 family RNA polymerase sigma factor [Fodinibius sp.]